MLISQATLFCDIRRWNFHW